MNEDNMTASVTIDPNTIYTTSTNSTISITGNGSYGAIAMGLMTEDLMEKWIMNRVTIDHKVSEHELMRLKEVAPDYANEIKENLTKNVARDIIKKVTFTKRHDKNSDVHHFIGRVWVFTEEELKSFINEVKNA